MCARQSGVQTEFFRCWPGRGVLYLEYQAARRNGCTEEESHLRERIDVGGTGGAEMEFDNIGRQGATKFPHLFEQMDVRGLRLKNRLFSAPVQTSYLDGDGYYTDYAIGAFAEKARGGAAMVCVGDTPVDSRYAVSTYRHPVLDDPGVLPSLSEVVRAVHEYGAAISVELNHAGSMAHPEYITGPNPIGPVDYLRKDGQPIKAMDGELMAYTLDSYAQAAAMAKLAGFDIINIQAGHGWLLHQFLSPRTNTRKDQYGGSVRNRCRFPLEVLARVRETVGPDMVIMLSVSAAEHIKGGDSLPNTVEFIKMARPYVDMIYVSASVNTDSRAATIIHSTPYQPHRLIAHYAAAIKKTTDLPVVAVGGIMSPDEGEEILDRGDADAVAMARALIADPYLPYKAKHRNGEGIRPCLRCLTCLNEMSRTRSCCCTVNPTAFREFRLNQRRAEPQVSMHVVVVGGGPAGMSAALSAAREGHAVTLLERMPQLGGHISRTLTGPFRADTAEYIDYLEQSVRRQPNIQIRLGTEATPEAVAALSPQAVILAAGSRPRADELPGWEQSGALEVTQVYEELDRVGYRVLVVGGGVSGCEAALFLAEEGREVTILDEGAAPMPKYSRLPRIALIDLLMAKKVELRANTRVTGLIPGGVTAENSTGRHLRFMANTVVVANGRRTDEELLRRFSGTADTVAAVGGCHKPGSLLECIHGGYFAGRNIEYY